MTSSFPPTNSKELWCFACNSIKITCIHDNCPAHCNMCDRIKSILMRTNGIVWSSIYNKILWTCLALLPSLRSSFFLVMTWTRAWFLDLLFGYVVVFVEFATTWIMIVIVTNCGLHFYCTYFNIESCKRLSHSKKCLRMLSGKEPNLVVHIIMMIYKLGCA